MTDRYDVRIAARRDAGVWVLIGVMFLAGVWAYPNLPGRVPSHWNFRGEVDGYSGPLWGAFGVPAMALVIYLAMLFLPLIDPRRENYMRFAGAYALLRWSLAGVMAAIHLITLGAGLGYPVRTDLAMQAVMSLLVLVIGNVMGLVRQNWFVGIRTPWTLADDEVWRQTHRVSAWVWSSAGLFGLAAMLLPAPYNFIAMLAGIMGAAVFSVIYSYVLFRRRHP